MADCSLSFLPAPFPPVPYPRPSHPRPPPSFSSFSPFNLPVRAYRAGKVKPRINARYKGATNVLLYLPFFLYLSLSLSLSISLSLSLSLLPPLSLTCGRPSRYVLHSSLSQQFVPFPSTPLFRDCNDKRGVPAIDLSKRALKHQISPDPRERERLDNKGAACVPRRNRERKEKKNGKRRRGNKRAEGRRSISNRYQRVINHRRVPLVHVGERTRYKHPTR